MRTPHTTKKSTILHCSHRKCSRVYETVERPSVCPFVSQSHHSAAAAGLLLWARRQEISIDSGGRRAPSSMAHGSKREAEHGLVDFFINRLYTAYVGLLIICVIGEALFIDKTRLEITYNK